MSEMDELVDALREAFFAVRAAAARVLADLDCTAVERGVLAELDLHGPRTVPVMARRRSISRQAMQKTVDALIARHWLRPEVNPEHARSPLISLTPAGAKLWATIRGRESALLARREPPVSPGELARTAGVLAKLRPFFEELS